MDFSVSVWARDCCPASFDYAKPDAKADPRTQASPVVAVRSEQPGGRGAVVVPSFRAAVCQFDSKHASERQECGCADDLDRSRCLRPGRHRIEEVTSMGNSSHEVARRLLSDKLRGSSKQADSPCSDASSLSPVPLR